MRILTRCRDVGDDPFQRGLDELQHAHPVWFHSYPPEPAVEQKRCSWCCHAPCECDELDSVDRGETDVEEWP